MIPWPVEFVIFLVLYCVYIGRCCICISFLCVWIGIGMWIGIFCENSPDSARLLGEFFLTLIGNGFWVSGVWVWHHTHSWLRYVNRYLLWKSCVIFTWPVDFVIFRKYIIFVLLAALANIHGFVIFKSLNGFPQYSHTGVEYHFQEFHEPYAPS